MVSGKQHTYTTDDIRYVLKRYHNGDSVYDIAHSVGVSFGTMVAFIGRLRKWGYTDQNRNKKQTIIRREKALVMLKKGYEKYYIAEVLGLHHATICKYAKSIGIVRKKGRSNLAKSPSKVHPWMIKNNALYVR
jgi:transposase